MRERGNRSGDSERSSSTETKEATGNRPASGELSTRLQRALGNSAVQTLHENGDLDARGAVSDPNDRSEREADRVAGSMPSRGGTTSERAVEPPDPGTARSPSNPRLSRTVRGELNAGKRLPPATREHFETQFDADFSGVRVHEGGRADDLATSLGADAFTLGTDLVFADGNYVPNTASGRELLAHELTHVVQQRGAGPGPIQREVSDDPESRTLFDDPGREDYPTLNPTNSEMFGWDARGRDVGWIPPFGGDRLSTYDESYRKIREMKWDLSDVMTYIQDEEGENFAWRAQLHMDSLLDRLEPEAGSLTPEHARQCIYAASFYYDVLDATLGGKPEDIFDGMREVRQQNIEFDRIYQRLSESLHNAFIAGAEPEALQSIGTALNTVDEARSHVDSILASADFIEDTVYNVDLPDFLSELRGISRQFDNLLSRTTNLLDAAELMLNFAGDAPTESMQMINQFQNFIDGIDFAMGFVNRLPVFGAYWSNYLKPLTDQCIEGLSQIAEQYDRRGRELAYLVSWDADSDVDPEDAPQIPEEYAEYFPGGQPVLDYMWGAVNETGAPMTGEALAFFREYEDHIRAVMPLEVSSDNVASMVEERPQFVWMMLYGGLPTRRH